MDVVLDRVVVPARHFALRVFPRLNMGPTANFGAAPVGVRTLELADPSRQNGAGTGPRTLTVEVYYPSTAAAVAGVPRDVVKVFGIELFPTPTYRDVARSSGKFPLILYSHGSGGVRFENLVLAVHLASHGYVVVAADHPGDTLLDPGDDMTAILTNRPKDISFLIDQFLGFTGDDFFAGAIDGDRIGVTGWSYGGYTALALAAGSFSLGTFTDPRVKAILPLDASARVFDPDVPALYSTIKVPTLLLGASLSDVIAPRIQQMFDGLSSGPSVVGYGELPPRRVFQLRRHVRGPGGLARQAGGLRAGVPSLATRPARRELSRAQLLRCHARRQRGGAGPPRSGRARGRRRAGVPAQVVAGGWYRRRRSPEMVGIPAGLVPTIVGESSKGDLAGSKEDECFTA